VNDVRAACNSITGGGLATWAKKDGLQGREGRSEAEKYPRGRIYPCSPRGPFSIPAETRGGGLG